MKASELKRGDRFSFIPANWFGLCEVIESRPSSDFWKLAFEAKVINPPGIWYGDPNTKIRKLKPKNKRK